MLRIGLSSGAEPCDNNCMHVQYPLKPAPTLDGFPGLAGVATVVAAVVATLVATVRINLVTFLRVDKHNPSHRPCLFLTTR